MRSNDVLVRRAESRARSSADLTRGSVDQQCAGYGERVNSAILRV